MSEQYVYIQSEPLLWTVGFYDPDLNWQPESDHDTRAAAAHRVMQLNGNPHAGLVWHPIETVPLNRRVLLFDFAIEDRNDEECFVIALKTKDRHWWESASSDRAITSEIHPTHWAELTVPDEDTDE